MIVAKFGGTSVANAVAIRRLVSIVASRKNIGVVVVSALSGVTDQLVACCNRAHGSDPTEVLEIVSGIAQRHRLLAAELAIGAEVVTAVEHQIAALDALVREVAGGRAMTLTQRDRTLATGELLSSLIVTEALRQGGIPATWVDARLVVVTDTQHSKALPLMEPTEARLRAMVAPLVEAGQVVVMGGFIGAASDGTTTTLGRGGSDYSASIIGAGLGAERIEIWTDVDGMLTADPRIVTTARLVPRLSFAEASELAYFGAKVLHPSTILPAMALGIPVSIHNSKCPDGANSLITAEAPPSDSPLRALACKKGVTVVDIASTRMLAAHGFLHRVFEVFDRLRTVVDVVTTSEVNVSVTIDDSSALDAIMDELAPFSHVTADSGFALVCAVGERLRSEHSLCARVLEGLGDLPVRMVSQAASRRNVTVVIGEGDLAAAMTRLHAEFFEGPDSQHLTEATETEPCRM